VDHSSLAAEASIQEELPGAGKPHAGICAVLPGNWQSIAINFFHAQGRRTVFYNS
jgi:hypothetical protein